MGAPSQAASARLQIMIDQKRGKKARQVGNRVAEGLLREGIAVVAVDRQRITDEPAAEGVHEITPFVSTAAPAGGFIRVYVRTFVGTSGSVAVFVTTSVSRISMIVLLDGTFSTGTEFAAVTITRKLLVALKLGEPSSETRTVTTFVLGPWVAVGVHVMAPPEETVRPAGPETSAKVSVLAGTSESTAVAFTLSVV